MSSDGYVKTIRSEESFYLARKHPNAFILLHFIALRARRENGYPDGLTIGQCHLGDYKEYGLTEKEYRVAKQVLERRGHIKIIETCRSRKSKMSGVCALNFKKREKEATERATASTTIGTLVELCSLTVYDINPDDENQQKGDRNGDRRATEGRPKGDEQEYIDISKDISSYKEYALNAKRPRSASPPRAKDALSFDFVSWKFTGITEDDIVGWKAMYIHINLDTEVNKACQWLRSNPSKAKKTLWRKFLTGWFHRANDWKENKKAYSSISPSFSDRRTKDLEGNPIKTKAEALF